MLNFIRQSRCRRYLSLIIIFISLIFPVGVDAHAMTSSGGGFIEGLIHPVFGADHLIALIAVGIWGSVLGRPAIWVLPITFPIVMAMGGLIGFMGLQTSWIDVGVSMSAVIIGFFILIEFKAPLWLALIIIFTFAIFHGVAHGSELPANSSAINFSLGFVITTGLLHLSGILLGETRSGPLGKKISIASGGTILMLGLSFLWNALRTHA